MFTRGTYKEDKFRMLFITEGTRNFFSSQPCANIQTNSLIVTRLLEERIDCETKMTSHFDVK